MLKIYDERGDGVGIKGGYFSPYSGTQFAMYRPATYQSIAGELPTEPDQMDAIRDKSVG